jgi:hypothetical protein
MLQDGPVQRGVDQNFELRRYRKVDYEDALMDRGFNGAQVIDSDI